jgi:ATP-dependent helicase/nuclease subunit A
MNLHKAKGLEAPVVFLADPLGGWDPRVDVRIVRPPVTGNGHVGVGYFQIVADSDHYVRRVLAEPPDWDAHEAAEMVFLTAEINRLLYVAATRARDLLVVGRYLGSQGKRKAAWDVLTATMAGAPTLQIPPAVSPPAAPDVDLSADAAAQATVTATGAHERARQPSWSATSVTAEVTHLPRVTVESLRLDAFDATDPTRAIVPDTPSHRADAGMAWGTLVHGLLEHAMRHRAATRDDLRRLALWLTVDEPGLRAAIDQALDTVQAVAGASFWAEARASAECHEEVPFALRDTGTTPPMVVTGAIDLVHRYGDGWRVIDYKTDRDSASETLAERYAQQLRAYGEAWGRVAGAPSETKVVSVRKD